MLRSFQRSCFLGKRNFATSISRDLAYDVVIIGGGVAGVTLACALGKQKKTM